MLATVPFQDEGFIGYLVAGVPGATLAAIGIFLPVWVLTVVPAPWFKRHRANPQLRAFSDGATAAATGVIAGAVSSWPSGRLSTCRRR